MSHFASVLLTICLACPNPIHGTADDDHLRGTRQDDVIYGYQGNDIIRAGRGAADVLDGGRGDDVLRAATGGEGRPIDEGVTCTAADPATTGCTSATRTT